MARIRYCTSRSSNQLQQGSSRIDDKCVASDNFHSKDSAAVVTERISTAFRDPHLWRRSPQTSRRSYSYSSSAKTMWSSRSLLFLTCCLAIVTFGAVSAFPVSEPLQAATNSPPAPTHLPTVERVTVYPSSFNDDGDADRGGDLLQHVTTDTSGDNVVGVTSQPARQHESLIVPSTVTPSAAVLNDSPASGGDVGSPLARLVSDCPPLDLLPACTCHDSNSRVYLVCTGMEDLTRLHTVLQQSVPAPAEIWLRISGSNFSVLSRRTFGGLRVEGLQINSSNVSAVADTTFVDVQNLKSLALQDNRLTEIPVPALRRLLGMEMLSLAGNRITSVPTATFLGLPHLYYVSLSQNAIVSLQRGSFGGGLRQLALSNNRLRTLNESVHHLTNLEWLLLTGNQLISLRGELVNLPSLTHLHVGDNRIRDLGEGALSQLAQLKALNVSHNLIERLDGSVFAGLVRLDKLDLSANLLSNVSSDAFRELQKLTILNLADNRLTSLRGALLPLTSLQRLNLANNLLENFDLELDLQTVTLALRHLDLSGNRLTHLQGLLFGGAANVVPISASEDDGSHNQHPAHGQRFHSMRHLAKLEQLILSGNQLVTIASNEASHLGPSFHLPSLISLHLDRNYLTEVDERLLPEVPRLQLLNVSGNVVTRVATTAFRGLQSLTDLDLSSNRLQRLDDGVFVQLARLQILNMSGNLLERMDGGTLEGLRSLLELDVSGNRLNEVEATAMQHSPALQVLDLANNRLKTVREFLRPLQSLQSLNLGNNVVEVIDGQDVEMLKNLLHLNLSTNSLMTIGINSQVALPKLVSLRVDSNRLAHVNSAFTHLPNLLDLDLRHNRLARLTVDTFSRNTKLRSIKIQGNPWMCDSSLIELFLGLEANSAQIDDKPWCINDVGPMEGLLIN